MPIRPHWLARGIYVEYWEDNISRQDVIDSSHERSSWFYTDTVPVYVVIIELSACTSLPPLVALREGTAQHPRGQVHFILCTRNSVFRTIGFTVSKVTGYYIKSVDTLEIGLEIAQKIMGNSDTYTKIKPP